jgi:hypothetical protein
MGPRAARHTLPVWPPPGMIVSGTSASRVCRSCRKFSASLTSAWSCTPAASQKEGRITLIGTLVTYHFGVLMSC